MHALIHIAPATSTIAKVVQVFPGGMQLQLRAMWKEAHSDTISLEEGLIYESTDAGLAVDGDIQFADLALPRHLMAFRIAKAFSMRNDILHAGDAKYRFEKGTT